MIHTAKRQDGLEPQKRAEILIEALPYLREFSGQTVVIKYGGNAMQDETLKEHVMRDIALLRYVGIRPVVVHGGGPDITGWLEKIGHKPEFIDGLRVTDDTTVEVVEMVLAGKTNKGLVALLNRHGALAVGLSGKDANLLVARKLESDNDLGHVGEILQINSSFLNMLLDGGYLPVICPVAVGQNGETYNVNADHAAGAVAAALKAKKLIVLTDVEGLFADYKDASSLISELDVEAAAAMIASGKASSGMIPKLESCVAAVQSGVAKAHLIDGTLRHSMLIELFTDSGIGTMVVPNTPWRAVAAMEREEVNA
jgi:acetylglutamate kinase